LVELLELPWLEPIFFDQFKLLLEQVQVMA
jgi:hypothetical protein